MCFSVADVDEVLTKLDVILGEVEADDDQSVTENGIARTVPINDVETIIPPAASNGHCVVVPC